MGLEQAYSHKQHALEKHDYDIWHATTGNKTWTSMTMTRLKSFL